MIGVIRQKRTFEAFPGDDESAQEAKAVEIKNLCAKAAAFAGSCSSPQAAAQHCPIYARIRDDVLVAVAELDGGFYRDFSTFYAIEMCVAASELELARSLYGTLTVEYIRWRATREVIWFFIVQ